MANTSGLSGYALHYANALNSGKGHAEAERYAQAQMGGSGLASEDTNRVKNTKNTSTSKKTTTSTTQKKKINTSGLSGYALNYANAMNSGMSDSEASQYAAKQMGGSGLKRDDVDKILEGTGTTSTSQKIKYDPGTGYAVPAGYTPQPTQTPSYDQNTGYSLSPNQYSEQFTNMLSSLFSPQTSYSTTQTHQTSGQYGVPYEAYLRDILEGPSAYTPLSDADLAEQARQYADIQVSPLLTAIQTNLTKSTAAKQGARGEIEASYAGVPAAIQARIGEARQYAEDDAIARGMGRSGVVNWETEKRTTPLMQQEAQLMGEKAAKLSGIDREIAALEEDAANQQTELAGRRGTMEATRLADLRNLASQMAMQADTNKWNQSYQLATLANNANQFQQGLASNANQAQQNLLMSLLPMFLGGI